MSSIFLSHNSKDKPFVRKLADDLRKAGFYAWVDEAEIKLGDSLIEKIREGIDKTEYVGVVLSNNSINSEWVKKEIDIAMNQEIEGRKVKVLPIMLEHVEPPSFLKGKLYADFTSDDLYKSGLKMIIERLSESSGHCGKNKFTLPAPEADILLKQIEKLKAELNVSEEDKRLLMKRLEKERRDIPDSLKSAIEADNDFEDINKYYAFNCSGIPVTAGYVLHCLRKEIVKGGPHQLALLCEMTHQTDELAILLEAVMRKLNECKK